MVRHEGDEYSTHELACAILFWEQSESARMMTVNDYILVASRLLLFVTFIQLILILAILIFWESLHFGAGLYNMVGVFSENALAISIFFHLIPTNIWRGLLTIMSWRVGSRAQMTCRYFVWR